MNVTEPSMMIVGRNRGGRPRKAERTYPVSTRVPERDADCLIKLASYNGQSVAEFVRCLVQRAVRTSEFPY